MARQLTVLLVLGAIAGCSGALPDQRPAYPGQEPTATVVANGTEAEYVGMTIYINSSSGFRSRLGSISVGGRATFRVHDIRPGTHWLEGRAQGTEMIRSREFMLRDGDAVEWDLDQNDVFYR